MVRHLAKLNQVHCPHACLPPTRLFTVTLTTALSSSTRATALPAGQRLESNPHTHARGPLPPSRDAAPPLHPHLDPNQARVIVGRSIAIVGQLRRPSRSARAVDARAATSQPTEPLQPEPSRAARAATRAAACAILAFKWQLRELLPSLAPAPGAAAARVLSSAASA